MAFVGRTNVGKSSIANAMLGNKMSITSSKTQTTRVPIRGVLTLENGQIVFLDTPGIHKPKKELGKVTNSTAYNTATDADILLFVIDAKKGITAGDKKVYSRIEKLDKEIFVVINKVDKMPASEIALLLKEAFDCFKAKEYIPVSAKNKTNILELIDCIINYSPVGPKYYDESSSIISPLAQYVSECIREKYLWVMFDEIPHSIHVEIDPLDESTQQLMNQSVSDLIGKVKNISFKATIYIERESQKGIVIGDQANILKKVGTQARLELEELLKAKVLIKTVVKLKKEWQSDKDSINNFGFSSFE